MKTSLTLCLAVVALTSARAQIFRPEAVNGAVLGGIAGAVIGNNSGDLRHNAWKGAAIGAGAGLILGEAVGNANAARGDTRVPASGASRGDYVYRNPPAVQVGVAYGRGYGYGSSRHDGRSFDRRPGYSGYYGGVSYTAFPAYSYYPGYGDAYPYYGPGYYGSSSYYGSGSNAANGLFLGALAGGIIGHNSGAFRHNGWRGAAWGAGAGWLLGTLADANRRAPVYEQAPVVVQPTPVPTSAAPQQPVPVTIINNSYNAPAPMSGANALFGR